MVYADQVAEGVVGLVLIAEEVVGLVYSAEVVVAAMTK